jgi:hypothetical protein
MTIRQSRLMGSVPLHPSWLCSMVCDRLGRGRQLVGYPERLLRFRRRLAIPRYLPLPGRRGRTASAVLADDPHSAPSPQVTICSEPFGPIRSAEHAIGSAWPRPAMVTRPEDPGDPRVRILKRPSATAMLPGRQRALGLPVDGRYGRGVGKALATVG